MTIANTINKITSIKKQTALGAAASGSGGSVLTRNSSVFSSPRDTFESNVITAHQQSTGVGLGMKRPTGMVDSLLSNETFALLFAGILRKDFTATTALTTLSLTIAGTGPYTLTRSAGDFLAGGIKVGDVFRITAGTYVNAVNRDNNFLATAVTATVITFVTLNGTTAVAEGPIASSTVTVFGKKSIAPVSSQTNDYFTIEEWYSDLSRSEVFADARINKIDVALPATGNATFKADFLQISRTATGARVLTTPTEPTFREMTAVNGKLYVNGAAQAIATGVNFTIDSGGQHTGPVIASNSAPDISRNSTKVSGTFTAFFDSVTLQALFDAQTRISLIVAVAEDTTNNSAFMAFTFGKITLTGDAPDDPGRGISRTYTWVAEYNDAGGAALNWDSTIMTVQDSQL